MLLSESLFFFRVKFLLAVFGLGLGLICDVIPFPFSWTSSSLGRGFCILDNDEDGLREGTTEELMATELLLILFSFPDMGERSSTGERLIPVHKYLPYKK